MTTLKTTAAVLVFAAAAGTHVNALAAGHETPAASARSKTTDELVVTVRKEEESLQEVPISVNVIDQQQLFKLGLNSLSDVTKLTPSLIFDQGFAPQDTRIVIRGLAPTRGRQNVAVLQDGIDISSEAIGTAGGSLLTNPRLYDLERVEVVKGPQGAIYGRSAFAGAINYVTKRPGDEFSGVARIDVSNQNFLQTTGGISGPLIKDKLNVGLNVGAWDEEGYYRNSITGSKAGGTEGLGFSATALFTPTEAVEFFGRVEYTNDEFDPPAQATDRATETLPIPAAAQGVFFNSTVTDILVPQGRVPDSDTLLIRNSENPRTGVDYPGTDREIIRFSLIGEFDLGWADLTWFSHVANVESRQFIDGQRNGSIFDTNAPGAQVFSNSAEINYEQETDLISQELRISRQSDGPIDWAAGVLFWQEKAEQLDGSNSCFVFLPFPADRPLCDAEVAALGTTVPLNRRFWSRETTHWSGYVDIDWRFAEQWVLGFEARYAEEDLDVIGPDSQIVLDPDNFIGGTITGPANNVAASKDDDYIAPKVTLQWMPSEDVMFYGSIAKGVKPAGLSTISGGVAPFVPSEYEFLQEKVWVYEIGGKSTLADGRVILNGAVFFQDFTDKQTATQVELAPGVIGIKPENAGKAEIWGFETDVTWFATDNLSITGSYTWLQGEYKEFLTESTGGSSVARAGNCVVGPSKNDPATDVCTLDLSGRDLEGLPEHALVGIVSYQRPLTSELGLLAEFQAQYTSERYQSEFNVLEFQDYWVADLRLGLQTERWDVIAYVDNVFDDRTTRSGLVSPDFTQFSISFAPPITVNLPNQAIYNLARPRTTGVRAAIRF